MDDTERAQLLRDRLQTIDAAIQEIQVCDNPLHFDACSEASDLCNNTVILSLLSHARILFLQSIAAIKEFQACITTQTLFQKPYSLYLETFRLRLICITTCMLKMPTGVQIKDILQSVHDTEIDWREMLY